MSKRTANSIGPPTDPELVDLNFMVQTVATLVVEKFEREARKITPLARAAAADALKRHFAKERNKTIRRIRRESTQSGGDR